MRRRVLFSLAILALTASPVTAQTEGCEPVGQRAGREFGCFIMARQELGPLSASRLLYWHLDTFPTSKAANAAKGPRGTVVESLGHIWLYTIAARTWHSSGGSRVATIGPLPLIPAKAYAAVYMEGVFRPRMQSPVHRHPGVEAWYTLAGSMCLETSEGIITQHASGPGVMVRAGVPMILTGTGSVPRRSVVLILQDSAKDRSTLAHDWVPRGLCLPPPSR